MSCITLRFLAEPSTVNFGGKVHGGTVMKWIDEAGYACATSWAKRYCVTVYVGGIRFHRPIMIGDLVEVEARLACTGKSYGGFLSAWAIGNSSRFTSAVVSAPVANIESHLGTSDTGYFVTPYAMGAEPTDADARYHALSPIRYCRQSHTPTLILQGKDDQRCPVGQSEELFANLVRCASAPARLVVYPGGSHDLAATGKPSQRVDYHQRLAAWVQYWTAEEARAPEEEEGATRSGNAAQSVELVEQQPGSRS